MKTRDKKPAAAADAKQTFTLMSRDTISRREFLVGSAAVGVTILLPGKLFAAVDGKKTFTILHTNDLHSNFIGMGPAADYTPFKLNLKKGVTAAVFVSRGYSIDQPLAIAPQDLPNTFTDIAASTPLANLVTDAFRKATKADIGFTVNGSMRAPRRSGRSRWADGVWAEWKAVQLPTNTQNTDMEDLGGSGEIRSDSIGTSYISHIYITYEAGGPDCELCWL